MAARILSAWPARAGLRIERNPDAQGQTHLSAEQPPPREDARFPDPHAHPSRARDLVSPPPQGPRAPHPLTFDVHATQVRRVFDVGRSLHSRRVVLFLAPGSGEVAVVASRRVGGAVQRNRARRILREAWREVAPTAGDGNDVVIVAREAIRGAKTQDLVAEMNELLRREPLVRR